MSFSKKYSTESTKPTLFRKKLGRTKARIVIFGPMNDSGKVIANTERVGLIIQRLCHQIVERHADLSQLCIIGIQERGVHLAERLRQQLVEMLGSQDFFYGMLDITFYRDDFRRRETPLKAASTQIDFLVEGRQVILVDDVLYTGRTVHAAMSALLDFGRPEQVEMLCMVDRRFNRHFPIKADYTGMAVDALDEAYVQVNWASIQGRDEVRLFAKQTHLSH
jgi:pyrimidine operon attenuation protein/uracil phosphoribosyltransferase